MKIFGFFGMMFGGTKEEGAEDRAATKAAIEEEIDYAATVALNRIAYWRNLRTRPSQSVYALGVDGESITALSHEAPVMPVAASKKPAPVDVAKLRGKRLRAHADDLGIEYSPLIGDDTLRARILGAE